MVGRDLHPELGASDGLHAPFPAAREREVPAGRVVAGRQPTEEMPFAYDLATATVADRPAASDRRAHYAARGAECRRLAKVAADHSIELIHLDMATRYDLLARQAKDESRHLRAVS